LYSRVVGAGGDQAVEAVAAGPVSVTNAYWLTPRYVIDRYLGQRQAAR
jgi:hypothetical protein